MAKTDLSPKELAARQKKVMSLDRQARIANGLLVLVGSVLAGFADPNWLIWPAFMGASLIFSGITDFCGFAVILARLPWNQASNSDKSSE